MNMRDIASAYSIEGDVPDYTDYIAGCDSARPGDTITIDADTYSRFTSGTKDDAGNEVDSDPKTFTDYEGMEGTSIESTEEGLVEYDVNVATAGLYDLSIEYYPEAGNSSAIQRAFFHRWQPPIYTACKCRIYKSLGKYYNR